MGVIHPDITKAQTLPSEYYYAEDKYEICLSKFLKSWNFIGLDKMFDEGSIVPIKIGNIPMVVTNENGIINCVSNVCTHRGMILCAKKKSNSTIVCPYHGRTFSLNGKIKHMPMFDGVENFPSESDHLTKAKVSDWNGMLFASLGSEVSLEAYLSNIEERMSFIDFSTFTRDSGMDREHNISANWMLYVDNYLEGFHIPYVHKGLNSVIDYSRYKTEVFSNSVLQIGYAADGEESFEIPENHPDFGKPIAAYYWWLFPNLMLNFYPWGLSINVVMPEGIGNTKVLYYGLVSGKEKSSGGAGGDLDVVEHEDQWIVESCNRGMKSSLYQRGRYSPLMETGVHHFHRMLTD